MIENPIAMIETAKNLYQSFLEDTQYSKS